MVQKGNKEVRISPKWLILGSVALVFGILNVSHTVCCVIVSLHSSAVLFAVSLHSSGSSGLHQEKAGS